MSTAAAAVQMAYRLKDRRHGPESRFAHRYGILCDLHFQCSVSYCSYHLNPIVLVSADVLWSYLLVDLSVYGWELYLLGLSNCTLMFPL